ncbi:hypothetical protein [Rathayibacter sp. VKM Ac-2805]|nr:hypothetical protein [Rathayibacter sp. VKM Ac-2805]
MIDETEEGLVALDFVTNRRASQDFTEFGPPIGSAVFALRKLAL